MSERRELSLGARISLITALLVAVPVAAAVAAAYVLGGRIARQAVERSLTGSVAVHDDLQERRAAQLALISRIVTSDPAFRGYVAEALDGGLQGPSRLDARSIVDLLGERQDELGFDFAMVLDAAGSVVARTDRPLDAGLDLSGRALIARVLEDLVPAHGLWTEGGLLYHAAAVPVAQGFDLIGFVVTGLIVDDAFAEEIRRVSGTDVAFLLRGEDGRLGRAASTLDRAATERLLQQIGGRRELLDTVLERSRTVPELDLDLAGQRMAGRIRPLLDARGATLGAAVAVTSLDRQLAPFRGIQRIVLLVGGLSLAGAVTLSLALSRRTMKPVRELAAAAEEAVRGDLDQRLESDRGDELGRMSRAFNALLGSLREQREMSTFVRDITRHLPDPVAGAAPRNGSDPAELPTSDLRAERPAPSDGVLERGAILGGRYQVLAPLGAGGMGTVYKARDLELEELVALKVLHRATLARPDHLERIKVEIRLARKITHPNVLRTFDFGEHEGLPYISMEYVRGLTLDYLLRQTRRLPYAGGLYLARQLCDGLGAAHEVGVLHRDVKPGNLILESNGNAKLMDFGIAAPLGGDRIESRRGRVVGTPLYLAPEVLAGSEPDVLSDIYSTGVVLAELFTGRAPFGARTIAELTEEKKRPPRRPSADWPEIPPALERIVLRCLDLDPRRRFADTRSLREALDEVAP